MRVSPFVTSTALGLLALAPRRAHAGNDDELLAGNHAAMMGGAVMASVDDASAAWYNPAGLGAISRSQVDLSGTVYTLRFYRAPDFMTLSTGESDDASVTEFVSIPTQIVYGRALASHLTLALGYFVPQATNAAARHASSSCALATTCSRPVSRWARTREAHGGLADLLHGVRAAVRVHPR